MIFKRFFLYFSLIFIGFAFSQILSIGYAELPLNIKWTISDYYFRIIDFVNFSNNETLEGITIDEKKLACSELNSNKEAWIINE